MSFIGRLLAPMFTAFASMVIGKVVNLLSSWWGDYMAKKKEDSDTRKINDAFKNPDRRQAAKDLNDVFKGE